MARSFAGMRKLARRGLLGLGALLLLAALLAAAGFLYGLRGLARDRVSSPPPGQLVEAGGHRLHLHIVGRGRPAVVLESGLPGVGTSVDWSRVLPELSGFTTAVAYDRAGAGWSEAGPLPRTLQRIAGELRAALRSARLPPPYVLVGHSGGGLAARQLLYDHPEEVAGLVLVDAAHEDQLRRLPHAVEALEAQRRQLRALRFLARIGLIRLLVQELDLAPEFARELSPEARQALAVHWSSPRSFATALHELEALEQGLERLRASRRSLGDLPLVVLTATRDRPPGWLELQAELARLGRRGRQRLAQGIGHYIQEERPDLVVDAIRTVVDASRARAAPLDSGSLAAEDPRRD